MIHRILSDLAEVSYQGNVQTEEKKVMIAASHDMTAGGAPIVLLSLLKFLKNEYDCFLIAPNDGEMTSRFVEEGFGVYIASPQKFDCPEFREVLRCADLYFCNTIVSGYFVSLAYNQEVPTIWWIHEDQEYFDYYSRYLSVDKCTSSNICIVAVAKRAAEAVERSFHVSCGLLHLGIEDIGRDTDRERYDDSVVSFFMPGNFISMKAHDVMVQAIRKLPKEYLLKTRFLFAGRKDKTESYLYDLVEQLEKEYENVEVLGTIPREQVYQLDRQMDCVVAPSRIDTLPTTIIEGMMLGDICICSDAAGISEYIINGESGFVFPSENSTELAKVMMYIVDHIDEMGAVKEKARKVYLENFTDKQCVEKVHKIVQNIQERKHMDDRKRIVLMAGYIDILDIFVYQLRDAFVDLGCEVFVCDARNQMDSLIGLIQFVMQPVMGMLTFNNCGVDLQVDPGINFWEQWNIPCVNILMDHPFCYHEELAATPSNGVVLCVDRNHMKYLSRFYPEIGICGYLPHGGIERRGRKKLISERTIDVLYVGGLSRNFADKIMPDFSRYKEFDAKELCKNAYEILIQQPHRTLEDVVEELLIAQNVRYSDERLREIISELHVIDLYVVSFFREKTVKTVAEAGINIELYGFGWEDCDWIHRSNVHYGGRISADAAVDKMKDSKVVLNTMTWFKDGTHDRVFNGMLQGAVTVSDSSIYMREEFDGDMGDMLLFELEEIELIPDKIKFLLGHPQVAQQIADNGYQKAKEKHTWKKRAKELEQDLLIPLKEIN